MNSAERGVNPIAVTIIYPPKECWLTRGSNHRLPVSSPLRYRPPRYNTSYMNCFLLFPFFGGGGEGAFPTPIEDQFIVTCSRRNRLWTCRMIVARLMNATRTRFSVSKFLNRLRSAGLKAHRPYVGVPLTVRNRMLRLNCAGGHYRWSGPPPGWLSGERVGLMTSWLWVRSSVEATFLPVYFHLSPLQKHVRKVVVGFGKKSCVSTDVRNPGNTCASPTAMIWP